MACIEDMTTASHRPFIWLPTFLLAEAIKATVLPNGNGEAGEPIPKEATIQTAINLIAEVPPRLLGDPDISPFYGEVHMSWTHGAKQVVLMCFQNRTSLIHHYLRVPNAASVHDIEEASADRLITWLRWLRA